MLERILLAVDGSEESLRAADAAAELSAAGRGTVVVVHVRQPLYVTAAMSGAETVIPGEPQEVANDLVKAALARIKSKGVEAQSEIVDAQDPARGLLETAEREQATMLVMGSRGLSNLTGLILGSVTHKIMHLTTLPVLVVR